MAKIDVGGAGNNSINIPRVNANDTTIAEIMNTVYLWAGIVAVLVIIIAGFFYVTANGNAQTIERAKNAILGSVIGLIVVAFAFMITQFVIMIGQSA